MITQELINRVQDLLRQRYILLKDEEIRRILSLYNGSIDYLIQLLLLNNSFQSAQGLDASIISTVNQALDTSRPTIESGYTRALNNMIDIGASAITVAMLEGRQKIGSKTQAKVEQLLTTGAQRLLNEGGAASAILGQDVDNKTKSTAKSISGNVANKTLSISENIWGDSREQILGIIKDGFTNGLSPYSIAEQIKRFSISGDGFKNAFRLAYTELTHAHSVAQVEAVRAWNSDPDSEFKLLIEQYLSPLHTVFCICDVLAGVYDPSKPMPKIPRHPNCNCGQRTLIDNKKNRGLVMSVDERIRAANLDEDFEVLRDIDNKISKGLVTKSSNKWNAQMEYITQNLKGEELTKAIQALANEVDLNDPVGKQLSKTIKNLYGIERQGAGTSSSSGVVKTANDVSINGQKLNLTQQEVDFIDRAGVKITTKAPTAADAESYGSYDIETNTMFFNPTTITAEAQNTFIHELAHAIDNNLGSVGSQVQRQLLSLKDEFNGIIKSPTGNLSSEANYIVMRRALGLTGEEGTRIQRYILSNTPYMEIPADLRVTASNLKGYFESPQELFAEGYMLFRTDMRFREFAPSLYNYYKNLSLNLF